MHPEKFLFIFGWIVLLVVTVDALATRECPNGVCRYTCNYGETEEGHCCGNKKCCVTGGCTETDPNCICKEFCTSGSEIEEGPCTCDSTLTCCKPCAETDPECSCKESCTPGSEIDGRSCFCDETLTCCKPCTDRPECTCRSICGESEDNDGPCECGGTCCIPCTETDPECSCKESCTPGSEIDGGSCFCDETLTCCKPCTDRPECTCRSICGESEDNDGPCECGGTCCIPCTETDPECSCKESCTPGSEIDGGSCFCDETLTCCKPCTDRPECTCRSICGESEDNDGPCECGGTCCIPCTEANICQDLGGTCKSGGCSTGTETEFGECCGGQGTCCVPCGLCTGSDVNCVVDSTDCPAGQNDLGPCCDGLGGNGRCCSETLIPCFQVVREGSTVPFSCKVASSPECGSSLGGSVNTGYCPTNNIKCCPECGWDCFDLYGGQSCKQNNQCSNQLNPQADDCCSPNQCCADPA